MLCKTGQTGATTYNEFRKKYNCNVIVIMRGWNNGLIKPNYTLGYEFIHAQTVSIVYKFLINFQHFFDVDENYHLKDDPCKTLSNQLYVNLNESISTRGPNSHILSHHIFHVAMGVFVPDGRKVISKNFVKDRYIQRNAKTSLRHWTKEIL